MIPLIIYTDFVQKAILYIKSFCKEHTIDFKTINTVEKENSTISIESIRDLKSSLKRSYTNRIGVILYDFESARFDTQNALLKLLEEECERIQFFLITNDIASLLPTIISRSKIITLEKKQSEEINTTLSDFALSEFGKSDKITKEKAVVIIDKIIHKVRIRMKDELVRGNKKKSVQYARILKDMQNTSSTMLHNNINPSMAVDHSVLQLFSI